MTTPYLVSAPPEIPPVLLDLGLLPSILNRIIELSDIDALTQLAATNKRLRKLIYDRYLPIQHVVFHRELGKLFGIDRNNKAVVLPVRTLHRNRSGMQILQVIWKYPPDFPALQGSLLLGLVYKFGPPVVRVIPTDRLDMIVTGQWDMNGGGLPFIHVTATFPMAWYNSPNFHDVGHCKEVFKELPKDDRVRRLTVIMVPHKKYRYCLEPHDFYELIIIQNLAQWLLPPSPLHLNLVFVGIEMWLKFKHPNTSGAKRRRKWQSQLTDYLSRVASAEWALNVVNSATFMTLEEYEKEVGTPRYRIHTEFEPPTCDFGDGRGPYDPADCAPSTEFKQVPLNPFAPAAHINPPAWI